MYHVKLNYISLLYLFRRVASEASRERDDEVSLRSFICATLKRKQYDGSEQGVSANTRSEVVSFILRSRKQTITFRVARLSKSPQRSEASRELLPRQVASEGGPIRVCVREEMKMRGDSVTG